MIDLHSEHDGVVLAIHPWGADVETSGGVGVFVDHAKVGSQVIDVGSHVRVVILDETRDPARGSMLGSDFEIARRLRVQD